MIVRRTPATLRHRFAVDTDGPVVVDAVSITTGAAVLTGEGATREEPGSPWTVRVPAAAIDDVDQLAVTWYADDDQVETVTVDVLGAPYVPVGQLRTGRLPTGVAGEDLDRILGQVIARVEKFCRVAFVPRLSRDVLAGAGDPWLWSRPMARRLVEISIDGEPAEPSGFQVAPTGRLLSTGPAFPAGSRIELLLEHGHDAPPDDLAAAVAAATIQLAAEEQRGHTVQRAEFAEGTSWLIATADPERGRPFGMPSIDAVLRLHRWAEVTL